MTGRGGGRGRGRDGGRGGGRGGGGRFQRDEGPPDQVIGEYIVLSDSRGSVFAWQEF